MKRGICLLAAAAAVWAVGACAPEAEPLAEEPKPAAPAEESGGGAAVVAADWTPIEPILTKNCAPCHTEKAADGVSLASQEGLMKVVTPGYAPGSEIVKSLRGTDGHKLMPLGRAALSEEEIKQIEDWITAAG
jgi:mono/diheme cytochrome c family protein